MKIQTYLISVLVVLLVAFLLIVGIGVGVYWHSQSTIKDGVRELKLALTRDFHDPESVRFRSVQLQTLDLPMRERLRAFDLQSLWRSTPSQILSILKYDPESFQLCGEVNAKNAFGAYIGYKRFNISGRKNPIPFIDADANDDIAKKMCDIGKNSVVYEESEGS